MPNAVDIELIEKLRLHMHLHRTQMARLCGVSKMSYMRWVNGGSITKKKAEGVRTLVKQLVAVIQNHGFPSERSLEISYKRRFTVLLELLDHAITLTYHVHPRAV